MSGKINISFSIIDQKKGLTNVFNYLSRQKSFSSQGDETIMRLVDM